MQLHELVTRKGCITLAKFVRGRTTSELEQILGYRNGRLTEGAFIGATRRKPESEEFDLLGYSNVAEHHFKKPESLDIQKLKKIVLSSWSEIGENQLVKIFPLSDALTEDWDLEYPPGWGAPQWKLTSGIKFEIVAFVKGSQRVFW